MNNQTSIRLSKITKKRLEILKNNLQCKSMNDLLSKICDAAEIGVDE